MKTKLILTGTLFALLMAGFANVGEQAQLSFDNVNHFNTEVQTESSELIMKGIIYNGEVLPYRELPEVEIRSNRNPETFTKAKLIDGEIVSVIELEEVVIHANL